MLWIAIHLPQLSLEAFCATLAPDQAQDPVRPVALVAEHRISAVNAAASEAGVRPGHKRATALALAADLTLGQADARRDAQALQAVAQAALAFTPSVACEGHDTVLLEVQGSLRVFGGQATLLQRLRQALAPLGHQPRLASAPTALGAALLARWREGFEAGPHSRDLQALQARLDEAPVWMLAAGREHWETLQGMGLQRLADLRRLPREGLSRRFGQSLLDDLDRARGTRADPRCWLAPPSEFESRLELFTRADSTEQVLHAAEMLLAQLLAWAAALQAQVQAFTLVMQHEARHRGDDGATPAATELRIELAVPGAERKHLQLLLRERLARITLAAPTLELRLRCSEWQRGEAPNGELFPTRQSQSQGLARLLERLRARLGPQQVCALQALADHRPEHASRLVDVREPAPAPKADLAALPQRPLWLLPQPQALPERGDTPFFAGQPLQLLSGPERIESGWWDGQLVARDYFIARDGDGALVWVFRSRLAQADTAEPGWFLHGSFA